MSSRLASVLAQLKTVPETQAKLASTYFDAPAAPKDPLPKTGRPSRRGMLAGAGIALGLAIFLAVSGASRTVTPLATFDGRMPLAGVGRQFGVWWNLPSAGRQSIRLTPASAVAARAESQALCIDYAVETPASAVGVWFQLPAPPRRSSHVEFALRGDLPGAQPMLILELRRRGAVERRVLGVEPQWATVRLPLTLTYDTNGEAHSWEELRLLFQADTVGVPVGRVLMDELQYVRVEGRR